MIQSEGEEYYCSKLSKEVIFCISLLVYSNKLVSKFVSIKSRFFFPFFGFVFSWKIIAMEIDKIQRKYLRPLVEKLLPRGERIGEIDPDRLIKQAKPSEYVTMVKSRQL